MSTTSTVGAGADPDTLTVVTPPPSISSKELPDIPSKELPDLPGIPSPSPATYHTSPSRPATPSSIPSPRPSPPQASRSKISLASASSSRSAGSSSLAQHVIENLRSSEPPSREASLYRRISKKIRPYIEIKTTSTQEDDDDDDEVDYKCDILYEAQRGAYVLGLPKFSSKTLIQVDPPPWSDRYMKFSPMDIHTYQLPDPTWEWIHPEWLVDMTGDVDEDGWEYAFKFHGSTWHGVYLPLRSFVRRRRWVRLRRRSPGSALHVGSLSGSLTIPSIPPREYSPRSSISTVPEMDGDEWYEQLEDKMRECRIDREKLDVVKEWLRNNGVGAMRKVEERLPDLMSLFEYEEARRRLFQFLLEYPDQEALSADPVGASLEEGSETLAARAFESLGFFSDKKAMKNEVREKGRTRRRTKGKAKQARDAAGGDEEGRGRVRWVETKEEGGEREREKERKDGISEEVKSERSGEVEGEKSEEVEGEKSEKVEGEKSEEVDGKSGEVEGEDAGRAVTD